MPRNKKGASTPRGANTGRVGFTLADEARQTSQHDPSAWSQNLRQRPVKFVSAGTSEPLKQLDKLLDENSKKPIGESTIEVPLDVPSPRATTPDQPHADRLCNEHDGEDHGSDDGANDEDDLIGPDELEETIQGHRTPKDETSFFFDLKGDQPQEKLTLGPVHIPDRPSSSGSSSSDEVILFRGRDAHRKVQPTSQISMAQMQTEIQVVENQIVAGPGKLSTQDTRVEIQTEVRVMEEMVSDPNTLSIWDKTTKRRKPRQRRRMHSTSNDDDDDAAILADYIANMRENGDADDILGPKASNRRELGGTDYYIPDELSSDDDITNTRAITNVENGKHANSTGPAQNGAIDENGSESEFDDETLAKLIAGHNLGIDEDVQFAGSSSDSSSSGDEGSGKKQANTANDDFDIMDWQRPSLNRRKGKGAKAQMNLNLSDSEMEQSLQAAWNNDRLRKSERKKQREELRALGMLGSKTKPEDLRVKYPDGMNMEQVTDEFQKFLLGSDEVLTLPPMDNNARKIIHELANKFKIKSKSVGKADQRRPSLYRTLRTMPYVESTFNQVVNHLNRRYFPRLDIKGKRSQRAPPPLRSNDAAATYRDGEIVGGAAPELGTDNRGRAMLEKMGWSSGTALGSMDNKGILQPVTQAMKRSKAGLG
ncbi:squalene synthetase-like protein [Neonectria magnoliae]|uniref:Protein SQS1 n=1 Tax=Neonectria magnoliae TaxID=2732573 RepID=A0ABR1I598_9HYPO